MTVCILCPGPSLANLAEVPPCELSIAVNRAAIAFECPIWAAMDYPMLRDTHQQVKGHPHILTRRQTWEDLRGRVPLPLAMYVERIPTNCPAPWTLKTMTCAMMYAKHIGATRIELYGCDWEGTADFDGKQAGENRTEKRWEQERRDVGAIMEWLRERDCEVVIHGNA